LILLRNSSDPKVREEVEGALSNVVYAQVKQENRLFCESHYISKEEKLLKAVFQKLKWPNPAIR